MSERGERFKQCATCRAWNGEQTAHSGRRGGCRRHAPVLLSENTQVALWPVTSWNDWCEEFIMHPDAEV